MVSRVPSSLDLIASVCSEFGSAARFVATDELALDVAVTTASGDLDFFRMLVREKGGVPKVREDPARSQRLPAFCPERHINDDRTLCLFWHGGEDAVAVRDLDTARAWWSAMIQNLERQIFAERYRRWPGRPRAHGDAAFHQARAEAAAGAFGASMLRDLESGNLVLEPAESRLHRKGIPIRLLRTGNRLFAKKIGDTRVVNQSGPCPCERPGKRAAVLRKCVDHADQASILMDALVAQGREEILYLDDIDSKAVCCGALAVCPLAARRRKFVEGRSL